LHHELRSSRTREDDRVAFGADKSNERSAPGSAW
jgi:hypothetical protein